MVDDLDGDAAGGGAVEGAGGVAVEGFPGSSVDLGLEGGLERLVGVVGAEEVGVADEEALLVVVGVDEPAGDAVGVVAADFAGVGLNTSTPLTLTWIWRAWVPLSWTGMISMSGSPKITNRLPLPVFLRSPAMCRFLAAGLLDAGRVQDSIIP